MEAAVQRVELSDFFDPHQPLHCPFCGARVCNPPGSDRESPSDSEDKKCGSPEDTLRPCPHTLFIATDVSFEFRSRRFNIAMGFDPDDDDPEPELDDDIDSFTDQVEILDAIKFASYQPAPSFFGGYIGFAPLDHEAQEGER